MRLGRAFRNYFQARHRGDEAQRWVDELGWVYEDIEQRLGDRPGDHDPHDDCRHDPGSALRRSRERLSMKPDPSGKRALDFLATRRARGLRLVGLLLDYALA